MKEEDHTAIDKALEIANLNMDQIQHVAWLSINQFNFKPSETVILCVECCESLKVVANAMSDRAEEEIEELSVNGRNPISIGAIESRQFNNFMAGSTPKIRLPKDKPENGKIRLFVLCEIGYIWLQIYPLADKMSLS